MGLTFTKLFAKLGYKKEMRILMVSGTNTNACDSQPVCLNADVKTLLRLFSNRLVLMLLVKPLFFIS